MTKWKEGLSATAVGRFGGMYDVVQPRAGLPCWTADACSLYINDNERGEGMELLRYLPEHPCAIHESANWTTRTMELKYAGGGGECTEAVIRDSLAWPARLIVSQERRLRLYGDNIWSIALGFPVREGFHSLRKVAHGPVREHDEIEYDRDADGPLSEPWMLISIPLYARRVLQLTFQRQPRRVLHNSRCLEFHFDGPAGAVAISSPTGIRPASPKVGHCLSVLGYQTWQNLERQEDTDLRHLLTEVRAWCPRLLAFPLRIRDYYRFDEQWLHLRQEGEFFEFSPNDWGLAPQPHLPVPPMLSRLADPGADRQIALEPAPSAATMDVRYYRQHFVAATSWSTRLAREHWVRRTLAPVAIVNDPAYEPLRRRMEAYLVNPTMTFHGDETWDKVNVQDCFANYRATAAAAWGVDTDTRNALWQAIGGGVDNLNPSQFVEKREPLTGQTWLAQRHIWSDQLCSYDYDWYIGQLTAGVWCKWFYQGRDRAWLERVMPLLEGQFAHYRIYTDWATLTGWCDLQRKNRWLDGLFYVLQGQIALSRLARELGRIELAEEAEYYALLNVACRDAVTVLKPYALELDARIEGTPGPTDEAEVVGLMDRENYGFGMRAGSATVTHNGCSVGIDVPELMVGAFERPALLQLLRRRTRDVLPARRPNWNTEFTRNGSGEGPLMPHLLDVSHTHFYMLYDHLIAEAMYLEAPLNRLTGLVALDTLAADILMVYQQATHPMLLVPANIEFGGCTWDESRRTLVARLKPLPHQSPDALVLISAQAPVTVSGVKPLEDERKTLGRAYALLPGNGEACFQF